MINNNLNEPLLSSASNFSFKHDALSVMNNQNELTSLQFDYQIDNPSIQTCENIIQEQQTCNEFPDSLVPKYYKCTPICFCNRHFIKAIISKNKIRLQKTNFDLDLVYITKRTIAMGYPSINCESLYRNSLSEVKKFLFQEHGTNFKVYNLCLEPYRIYPKQRFDGADVGLFPFEDHQACPMKLMLEFCVDICLFLLTNADNVGVIHCKAGKGRTGIMICSYLLFTGIANNSTQALDIYGVRRSVDDIGITVASQKRYVHHFETYLNCNFEKPYWKLIPKIRMNYLTPPNGNLLKLVYTDKDYYNYNNVFKIKKIKIGPLTFKTFIKCQIVNFKSEVLFNTSNVQEKLKFKNIYKEEHEPTKKMNYYYIIIDIIDDLYINSDINIKIESKPLSFNAWINLFYITLENFIYLVNTQFQYDNHLHPLTPKTSSSSGYPRRKPTQKKKGSNIYSLYKRNTRGSSIIEMNDLSSLTTTGNQIKQKEVNDVEIKEEKEKDKKIPPHKEKLFIRSYDANFFWEKNITLDGTKIKNFLKMKTNYKGEHIHSYDLNNIYEYMNKENNDLFDSKRKKFKIKMNSNGLDGFNKKDKMEDEFSIEITYYLDK